MTAVTTRRVAVAMVAYTSGPLFQARFETRPSFQLTLIRTSEMETLLLHKQGNRAMGGYRACLTSGGVGGRTKVLGFTRSGCPQMPCLQPLCFLYPCSLRSWHQWRGRDSGYRSIHRQLSSPTPLPHPPWSAPFTKLLSGALSTTTLGFLAVCQA